MRAAAEACGVELVTGDTKVVDRGKGDGLFINTAGIGVVPFTSRSTAGHPFEKSQYASGVRATCFEGRTFMRALTLFSSRTPAST
ncbi:hypothetical protein WMF28_31665 [Sorangium sp. So ce590]